jgi:hypothetical protein
VYQFALAGSHWASPCFINEPCHLYSVVTLYRSLAPQYGPVHPVSASLLFRMLPSHSLFLTAWQQLSKLGAGTAPAYACVSVTGSEFPGHCPPEYPLRPAPQSSGVEPDSAGPLLLYYSKPASASKADPGPGTDAHYGRAFETHSSCWQRLPVPGLVTKS